MHLSPLMYRHILFSYQLGLFIFSQYNVLTGQHSMLLLHVVSGCVIIINEFLIVDFNGLSSHIAYFNTQKNIN